MTFARGPLAAGQERFLALVMEAYELVMAILNSEERRDEDGGLSVRAVAQAVDDFFSKHGLAMPHGLGHGIGLQVHEEPYLRVRASEDIRLLPGMVFTVEPGLYAPEIGGCRFENDIVLTESGALALTHSAIVRL
jgi:Xaa-Pro aminopeptidase